MAGLIQVQVLDPASAQQVVGIIMGDVTVIFPYRRTLQNGGRTSDVK
jgi:hypothetical protein